MNYPMFCFVLLEQNIAYKVLKHPSRTDRDAIEINTIEDQK